MKRAPLNLLIDGIAAVLFVGMLATAYVIRYVLPPGSHRVLSLWGMHRHQWGEIHFWLSVGLIVVLLVHLSLHWNWVVTMLKRHVAGDKAPATHLFRAGLATVLVLVTGLVIFAWVAHLNVQPIAKSEPVDDAPPVGKFPNRLTATRKEKPENQEFFWKEVYPIFTRSCLGCHREGKQLGGFRVDEPEDFFGKAGQKPLVVPGNSAASPLIEIVSGVWPDMVMAAKHRLPNEEVDLLKGWIDAGADWPPKSQPTGEDKTLTDGKVDESTAALDKLRAVKSWNSCVRSPMRKMVASSLSPTIEKHILALPKAHYFANFVRIRRRSPSAAAFLARKCFLPKSRPKISGIPSQASA